MGRLFIVVCMRPIPLKWQRKRNAAADDDDGGGGVIVLRVEQGGSSSQIQYRRGYSLLHSWVPPLEFCGVYSFLS